MNRMRLTKKGNAIVAYLITTLVIVLGVIAINARFEYLNKKSVEVTETTTHIDR